MANELGFSSDKKVETLLNHEKFKFAGSTGAVTARAMLRSVTPDVPKSSMKLRRIEEQLGNHGQPIACGDKAYIKLAIWKQDGTQVFSNEKGAPLVFTVGYSQVPFGIEQGVEGMMPGGKRLVIIPPAYAAPLDADAQESLLKDLPENEILFAAVELLTEPKEAVPANIAPQQPATPPETKDK